MIISNDNINDSFREGLSSLNVFKNDEGLTQRCYHRARRDIDEVFGIKILQEIQIENIIKYAYLYKILL